MNKPTRKNSSTKAIASIGFFIGMTLLSGCSTTDAVVGGALGGTIVGGMTPSHQLEQIYYLGVFDPQDQIPPTIYRVIVRGQAAAISNMNFGSGWVEAKFIDSLGTRLETIRGKGPFNLDKGDPDLEATLNTGRRLMLFGPEGFREAPADYRLAIVMGSDPHDFFNAINDAMVEVKTIQTVQDPHQVSKLQKELINAMLKTRKEHKKLIEIQTDANPNPG